MWQKDHKHQLFSQFFLQFVFLYIKLTRRDKEKIQKGKEKTRERYQNLYEEKSNKKRKYGHEKYKNLSEDENQELVEYRKKYYEIQKSNWKVTW